MEKNQESNSENENNEQLEFKNTQKNWTKIRGAGFTNDHLSVRESFGKGLGVFANKKIKKNEVIEYCHALPMSWKRKYVHDPAILKFAYWSGCDCKDCQVHGHSGMILFGNGSIYNSADSDSSKNASYKLYPSLSLAIFTAEKDIEKDDEILTWWGQGYFDSWCKPKSA
jgi:SET domain-containing protein